MTTSCGRAEVNRLAHWLLSQGLQRGDSIALYMPNKPAYPILWLACLAIDVVPAFINFNLTGQGLVHCVRVAEPKLVVYESDLAASISDVSNQLGPGVKFVKWIDQFSNQSEKVARAVVDNEIRLDERVLSQFSDERIPNKYRKGITWQSPAVYIYTSQVSPILLPPSERSSHPG